MTSRRLLLGLFVSTALLASTVASALAVGSAGTGPIHPSGFDTRWGWVTVRSSAASYTPAARDQGNSLGGTNTVQNFGAGHFIVHMAGIGETGGNAQISTLGSDRFCGLGQWGEQGANENISVYCYSASGLPSKAKFTVTFINSESQTGVMAYLVADQPTTPDYTPYVVTSRNTTGGTNTIHRSSTGTYVVTLPGLASAHGNVQVTATPNAAAGRVAPAGAPLGATVCDVAAWYPNGLDESASVLCFDISGSLADAEFSFIFTNGQGLKGPGVTKVVYLWANHPGKASYVPKAAYRYSDPSGSERVTRQGTGRYTAILSAMPKGGAAKVTAYGSTSTRCSIASVRTSGTPQQVGVACYDSSGAPTDSKFSLSYER